jgi:hypothetical protein
MTFTFRPPYAVSGQDGKSLAASRRSLEQLGIESGTIHFRSADTDVLQWFQRGDSAPDYGQEVSIWDADGKRVFTGNCTTSDPEWDGRGIVGYQVTISGPWWWLEQAQLTGLVTDQTGLTSERPSFVFPAQDLAVSIRSLLDRMQALGVPMQCGNIDPTFAFVQMTMQATTAVAALRDMLAVIPDAMTRVRYDVDGLPALDVLRRPTAPLKTLELGTESDLTGIPRLRSRKQLRPSSVTVQSAYVDSLGKIVNTQQIAGDASGISGVLGRQLIAVSGPGRADFRSYEPRVTALRTTTMLNTFGDVWSLAQTFDSVISGVEDNKGAVLWTSFGDGGAFPNLPRGITGYPAYRHVEGEYYEWMLEKFGISVLEQRVTGWVFGTYPNTGWSNATTALREAGKCFSAYVGSQYQMAIFVDFTLKCLSASLPTLTVYVHPDDTAFVTPVANLAENLYNAQDWIPYDGDVPQLPGGEILLPGNTLNIRGALPEWETMRALVTGSRIDLRTGSGSLQIGASSRLSASALIDRFARPTSGRVINL